jgi:hypothetical protein
MNKWLDRLKAHDEIQDAPGGQLTKLTEAPSVSASPGEYGNREGSSGPFGASRPVARPQLPANPQAPADDTPEAWQHFYEAQAFYQRRMAAKAGRPAPHALVLAYGHLILAWHDRHGARPNPEACAGCGVVFTGAPGAVEKLADGAHVHTGNECIVTYGGRWRRAAAAGLLRLGIYPPEGWAP